MFPFQYDKAADEAAALDAAQDGARYLAGGTTLVDLMRQTVERPTRVVDINALPYRDIDLDSNRLRIGALARMSEVSANVQVQEQFPMLTQALDLSASAQLRNMASIGGNLLQRPRCLYFRDVNARCNRREPGSGCAAIDGRNRTLAILGTSSDCVAAHPSDLAVALTALDAIVITRDRDGEQRMAIADFFRLPGDTPDRENNLPPGALITAIEIPTGPDTRRSGYVKVRDRSSYEFALCSAAVALNIDGGTVRSARVAAGGVGTVPWRLSGVEERLVGQTAGPALWATASEAAADGAQPLSENGFKVILLQRTVRRQLSMVAALS
ncbi:MULTISPECIES: FAD binding domain-containing protein [unclassified Rhodococcus (in: high G+C Gram-positive bacteria)]|uniref:FAD binding domain-containing protein n=1 Tax=unclassified Rhodococcus (in: high G+C Gram-positive bacteria) TaxID=192944 RepID=UPI0006FC7DC8|nr:MULTISPECIES: xanthine dehydrogenase family protein subunit M [unclassified Rhodococcus (in: high G+C Gram-positive bacteria)]KQU28511.1 FAD-binding molybdopterin dehydrogenase [Rhodococcus sp. Leaf225]KQU44441.1 FAD-binding molybdopterin dehydrogenase [Rhodococcus sp. Leaf258]